MMKKIILLFVFAFTTNILCAQEIFFQVGSNLSTYNFSDPGNEVASLTSNIGSSLKIGYSTLKSYDSPFFYHFGVSLNQYNAKGNYLSSNLDYKTNYLGLFGGINGAFVKSAYNNLAISLSFLAESIVFGNQTINYENVNLIKEKEFKGLVLSPQIGLKYTYAINNNINLLFDYSFSKHFNISNKSTQKLSIQNHGFQIGLSFNMY